MINLRWPLRLACFYWFGHHDWQDVTAIDAFSRSFRYCKRCGEGWRYAGLQKCWFPWQHQWAPHGMSTWTDTGKPYRRIEHCSRCGGTRVIEHETGLVVFGPGAPRVIP